MERNTVLMAGDLKIGDRFYKLSDANKQVFQVVENSSGYYRI